jgi:hypothetical protein
MTTSVLKYHQNESSHDNITNGGAVKLADELRTDHWTTHLKLSENLFGDRGLRALADALRHNRTLQELDVSSNRFGDDGVAALAATLRTNPTLTSVCLDENQLSGDAAVSLARVLTENRSLRELSLSEVRLNDDDGGHRAMTALAGALRENSTLQTLRLRHNGLTGPPVAVLADVLRENTGLTWLDLSDNPWGEVGLAALGTALRVNTTLQHLELRDGVPCDDGWSALFDGLHANTALRRLNMGGHRRGLLATPTLVALAALLRVNSTLTTLKVDGHWPIDSVVGGCALADSLRVNRGLTQLTVPSRLMTDAVEQALAEALVVDNTTLTYLDMRHSAAKSPGPAARAALVALIKGNRTLQTLQFGGSGGDRDDAPLDDAWVTELSEALRDNSTLVDVTLSWNIGTVGALALAAVWRDHPTLVRLTCWGSELTDQSVGGVALKAAEESARGQRRTKRPRCDGGV